MVQCRRKGCGQEFDPSNNVEGSCQFHPGGPVFHEGLKSWSCCSDVNKPVLEFDEFMKIPPCTQGKHSDKAPQQEPAKAPANNQNIDVVDSTGATESFASPPASQAPAAGAAGPMSKPDPASLVVEEEDDSELSVQPGTKCRRTGCNVVYESDEVNRKGDGPGTVCTYHPLPPIFREGSKGYLCCKRRVLEFDEFLKIGGCKNGRHVFAPKSKPQSEEEFTDCRIDHYQTPFEVHVSVFAKQTNKERSKVEFEEHKLHLDLYLPPPKRFKKSLDLFGPIDPDASRYTIFGSKVEIILKKKDGRSWILLEKTDKDLGGINFTFGVGGRTGTIGAKKMVLDDANRSRSP